MNKPRALRNPLEMNKHVHIHPRRIAHNLQKFMNNFRQSKTATIWDRRAIVPRAFYTRVMDKMPKNRFQHLLRGFVAKKVG